jgi:hypothetical protein
MLLRELYEAPGKTAVLAFGRLNPPTIGHAKLVDAITAQDGDHYLFLSQTQKPKTDPLDFATKMKLAKQFFPGINIGHQAVRTPIQALEQLQSLGYTDIVFIAGSDRVDSFQKLFDTYNGQPDKAGNVPFKFNSIRVVSAGERDPDADGAEGMSASKMRAAAAAGDLESFAQGAPDKKLAKTMFDAVRKGMGVKDEQPATEAMPYTGKSPQYKGVRIPTDDTVDAKDITKKSKQVDMPIDTIDDFDFSGVDGAKLKKVVARLVSELPGSPKNIKVLQARFGLAPFQKAYTLQQVADAMGVTPEVVRQREAKAIRMLKHPSRSRELRPFLDESNPFTDARMNAIKANKDTFTVGGKTYKVTGDTSDEEKAVQEAELNEVAPAVAAVIWILKWAVRYGAWPVLKWLLKKHGGKIIGGAAAAYYIDQGWDWVKDKIGAEYAQMLIDNKFEIAAAVALILGAVALKKYMEKQGDKLVKANESMIEKAPPGREKQVKALKKKFDDPGAPYAIAWAQHNKKKSRA